MLQDRQITFTAHDHKYVDETGSEYTSVTTLIHNYQKPFDKQYWTLYSALRDSGLRVYPKVEERLIAIDGIDYDIDTILSSRAVKKKMSVTVKDIEDKWKKLTEEACERGNETHDYLEDSINLFSKTKGEKLNKIHFRGLNTNYAQEVTSLEELNKSDMQLKYPSVYDFLAKCIERGYVIYAEIRIYHPLFLIAGTIDVLLVKGDKFFILDWKTNKDELKFESGYYKKEWAIRGGKRVKIKGNRWIKTNDKLLSPLNVHDDCKGNIYTMQLSLYAYLCEEWGLQFQNRLYLCHIRKEEVLNVDGTKEIVEHSPIFYTIPYFKLSVKEMLLDHAKKTNNKLAIEALSDE